MRVRATHSIGDLARDVEEIAIGTRPAMAGVIRDGLKVGTALARTYAKESAGPHGKNYYKRISSSMNRGGGLFGNTISGEYGPSGTPKTDFVGVGFRNGHNTDLPRSADVVGPSLLRSVDDAVGELFKLNGF